MAENVKIYWIHAVTPVHLGSGEGTGFIDLPIVREKHTNWPYIPGSSFKGVLADSFGASKENRGSDAWLKAAFGLAEEGDTDRAMANAGSLVFSDARLVCLPVRSLYGTFAWVTTGLAVRRLLRDLSEAGLAADIPEVESVEDTKIGIPTGDSLLANSGKVYFGDLDFQTQESANAQKLAEALAKWLFPTEDAWRSDFVRRFAVASDAVFSHLSDTATEVSPRIRIQAEKKIVDTGALWYEESLPAETVAAGLVWCDRVYASGASPVDITRKALLDKYCTHPKALQIGGKASVGRGRVRCLFS